MCISTYIVSSKVTDQANISLQLDFSWTFYTPHFTADWNCPPLIPPNVKRWQCQSTQKYAGEIKMSCRLLWY